MKEIKKIIVSIDFHQHTDQIVEYALYLGRKLEASIKLTHVVEPPFYYGDIDYPSLGSFTEEVGERAEKMMKLLVEKHSKGDAGCEGKVLRGDIADSIIKYAADEQADLLVIGTHGRKGLEKMWLGSVAERVIKRAPCPTLTCNPYKETQ